MLISKLPGLPASIPLKQKPEGADVRSGSTSAVAGSKDQQKLRKACQDFESIFLNYLLSKMRESVPKSDLMGESHGEELYLGMLDEELSKQMAASGGVGLSQILYQQLEHQIQQKKE